MQPKTEENYFPYSSPISLLEEFFFQYEWNYERTSEHEITAEAEGRWCNYHLFAMWRQDLECLIFSSIIDIKIPQDKRDSIGILLSLLNPKVWMGHFEVVPTDDVPIPHHHRLRQHRPDSAIWIKERMLCGITLRQVDHHACQFGR